MRDGPLAIVARMRKKRSSRSGTSAEQKPTTTIAHEPSALLTAFQALSPSDVYAMAPKESVVRGFDYYQRHRLQGYLWSQNRSTLTASVQGSRPYSVIFSLDDGALIAHCDCPAWMPDRPCKHVLCACFTTKNLLSPDLFRLTGFQDGRRESLRAELLPGGQDRGKQTAAASESRPEIVIDARHNPPSLGIRLDGAKVTWASGWIPTSSILQELAPLLSPYGYQPGWGEDPLLRHLKRHAGAYPLILETRQKTAPLRWDPSAKCLSKTALDVMGDTVRIRAVCLADGVELDRFLRFRTFVADVNGGRLLLLDDERGWTPFLALQQGTGISEPFLTSDGTLGGEPRAVMLPAQSGLRLRQSRSEQMVVTVPLHEFRSMQIDLLRKQADRTLSDLILTIDGRKLPLLRRDHTQQGDGPVSRLVLVSPPASTEGLSAPYTLKVECRWRDVGLSPTASVFGFFSYLERARLSAPLRAWKRKAVMYETYLRLLSIADSKERDRRFKVAFHEPEFGSRAVRSEAQWILKSGLSAYQREDLRLQFHADRWELWPVEKTRETASYRIPCEVFGPEIFRGMRRCDEMTIEAQALFLGLPELLKRSTQAGIPLLYEDKPVQVSHWDCSLEVGRQAGDGTGIDWFEIRPEIQCDGVVVEETVWRNAVERGGLVKTRSGLRILDAPTLERLRALMTLTEQTAPGRGAAARIVQVPRLQIFDWLALREQGIRVSLPAEDEVMLARLLGFERISIPPLPKGLNATLRPYQRDGYGWLAFLYQHRFGACLADDMGLGKTLQAICLLAAIEEGLVLPPAGVGGPHLVVVPTSLLFNWEQELARFYPGLKVRVYTGSERTLDAEDGDVVLTTYGLARRDIDTLERTAFHVIVFDEAQAVKNLLADTTGAVRRLKGFFKIAMTGTPLENHLGEYFSIVDLCLPGLLGDYERFKAELKRVQADTPERLLRRTRPFVLRRTKAQTLKDLPQKIETEVRLDLTDRQKALYQQTVEQVRSTIDNAYRTNTQAQAQIMALTAILKLRQLCLSPRLLTGRADESSPKLGFLMERLLVLREEGHSALIFSQFTSYLDLVEESCDRHAVPHVRLDGSTAIGARKKLVTAFQHSEQPGVFLLSLKAGGQGLNLTKASYVFHLDPWWNPAVENQASDRAHRIGQKQTVTIVRLLMRHTIEEKMLALKQRKLDLYDAVMGGAVRGTGQRVLTKADFEFLLSPSGAWS